MWEAWVWPLGWEDPLEEGMATHSRILAWRIPQTEEPGRLQSMGSQRVKHDWAPKHTQLSWFSLLFPPTFISIGNILLSHLPLQHGSYLQKPWFWHSSVLPLKPQFQGLLNPYLLPEFSFPKLHFVLPAVESASLVDTSEELKLNVFWMYVSFLPFI